MDPMDFSTGTTNPETFPTEQLVEAAVHGDAPRHSVDTLDGAVCF